MSTAWHADEATIARYAADELDFAAAASVEAHLLACAACRSKVVPAAGPRLDVGRLDRVWDEVVDRIDQPRAGAVERLLVRLGLADHTARLLAATPSLRVSWLGALGACLLFAVVAAAVDPGEGQLLLLSLAPLLPVAGVAVAYGPRTDPAFELHAAAPYSSVRLLLLRTAAVLATTLPLAAVAGLLGAGPSWVAAAWLLPALGLTALTLALGTYVDPVVAGAVTAVGWLTVTVTAYRTTGDALAAFHQVGQAACAALLLASVAVLTARLSRATLLQELS